MSDLTIDRAVVDTNEGPMIIVAAGSDGTQRSTSPHHHVRGQLMGSMRGLLSVGVGDESWIVPAIHAVWLPPRHVHSVRSHGPFQGWSVYITEEACRDLPDQPCTIRPSGLLREAVLRAAEWPVAPLDAGHTHIAQVILHEIRSLPVEPFGLPLPRDSRLKRIARELLADPTDARSLKQWADWAAVSSRTLTRRFVAETGFTFTAWRQRARLMRSLELLATDLPVATIAFDLGFSTPSAFITLFRKTLGETPAVYRQRL